MNLEHNYKGCFCCGAPPLDYGVVSITTSWYLPLISVEAVFPAWSFPSFYGTNAGLCVYRDVRIPRSYVLIISP